VDRFESMLIASLMTPLSDPNDPNCIWGIPLNVIGGSGVGKTARITSIAKSIGLPCYPVYSATKMPENFGGYPVPTPTGIVIECGLPQIRSCIDEQKAVLFLDEISCAPPAVQASLLSFVNERQAGEYVLPGATRIVLAMNPADVAANGHDLEIPMANRVAHHQYTNPTIKQWGEYITGQPSSEMQNFVDAEKLVKENWSIKWAEVANISWSFIEANAGLHVVRDAEGNTHEASKLHNQPTADEERAGGPWPSHRTWELASRGVAAIRCLGLEQRLEVEMISSLVGAGLATEWVTYANKMDLPSPEEALNDKWKPHKRLDVNRAVTHAAAAFITSQQDEKTKFRRAVQGWKLLKKVMNAGQTDVIVQPARVLINAGLDPDCSNVKVCEASEDVCCEINRNGMLRYILRKNNE